MAAPIKPQKVQSKKKDTWWYAPAVANMSAPTVAEVNAVAGLNFTCYLLTDQGGATASTNKVSLPVLLCEDQGGEVTDNVTVTLSDLVSVWDPQAAAGSTGKKTWELFGQSGASGFLIRRQNVINDVEANVSAGQFVDVFKVVIASGVPDKTANDATGLYNFTCAVDLTDHKFNKAVVV